MRRRSARWTRPNGADAGSRPRWTPPGATSDASLAKKTRSAYLGDWRAWIAWCASTDTAAALPATDEALAVWLASDEELANSTLRRRLSAVRLVHARAGHPLPPALPACRAVLRGHAHETRERGVRRQDALTVDRLVTVLDAIGADGPAATADAVRDAAMLLVGFDAALRPSELARLDLAHLAPLGSDVVLDVPWSKADQAGGGRVRRDPLPGRPALLPRRGAPALVRGPRAAARPRPGRTGVRRTRGPRPCTGHGRRGRARCRPARSSAWSSDAPRPAGLDGAYAGHSARRGRITSAIRAGAPLGQVREHARHRHVSTTLGYVESAGAIARHPPIVIGTASAVALPVTGEDEPGVVTIDANKQK